MVGSPSPRCRPHAQMQTGREDPRKHWAEPRAALPLDSSPAQEKSFNSNDTTTLSAANHLFQLIRILTRARGLRSSQLLLQLQ